MTIAPFAFALRFHEKQSAIQVQSSSFIITVADEVPIDFNHPVA